MKTPTNDNAALYARGSRYAEKIDEMIAGSGLTRAAALKRVAADLGLDVKEVKTAVVFRTAVDKITANAGPGARTKLLGVRPSNDPGCLSPLLFSPKLPERPLSATRNLLDRPGSPHSGR